MSTTDSTSITPKQLRELHLSALESLYGLDDQTIGAVEVILAVELAHWDISYTAALMDLHNFVRARKPGLHAHFSVGDEALAMIKALEGHNANLAETLDATKKELAALRSNYANLSDILLQTERERDQARTELANSGPELETLHQTLSLKDNSIINAERRADSLANELAAAHRTIGQLRQELKQADTTIKDMQAAMNAVATAVIDSLNEEAGTAAAENPPAPAPSTPQTHTANLISPVILPANASDDPQYLISSNGRNGNHAPEASNEEPDDEQTTVFFDWTGMPMVYQSLIGPLEQKGISWKSLSTEQKTKLAVEVAAQILKAQPDFPDTTLTHDLFNNSKPEWMTSLQGLAVGVPLPIQELRTLAVSHAHRRIAKIQELRRANGPASQAASQDASQDSASSSEDSAPSSNA